MAEAYETMRLWLAVCWEYAVALYRAMHYLKLPMQAAPVEAMQADDAAAAAAAAAAKAKAEEDAAAAKLKAEEDAAAAEALEEAEAAAKLKAEEEEAAAAAAAEAEAAERDPSDPPCRPIMVPCRSQRRPPRPPPRCFSRHDEGYPQPRAHPHSDRPRHSRVSCNSGSSSSNNSRRGQKQAAAGSSNSLWQHPRSQLR